MKIAIIGSGNLATQLSLALSEAGHDICQVYSRTAAHAAELANKLSCPMTTDIEAITKDADAYIFSVKDDAVAELAESICRKRSNAVFMHTGGSVPMAAFEGKALHYGVLYPMQSFSKNRKVDFKKIPFFLEANDDKAHEVILALASNLSSKYEWTDTEKRAKIHLAAVLSSNLANHCYRLAERVLQQEGIDFSYFLPLITETARKVSEMSPRDAQTGPMVRYDKQVMAKQMAMLTDDRTREIYRLMAESIHADYE